MRSRNQQCFSQCFILSTSPNYKVRFYANNYFEYYQQCPKALKALGKMPTLKSLSIAVHRAQQAESISSKSSSPPIPSRTKKKNIVRYILTGMFSTHVIYIGCSVIQTRIPKAEWAKCQLTSLSRFQSRILTRPHTSPSSCTVRQFKVFPHNIESSSDKASQQTYKQTNKQTTNKHFCVITLQ